jgi:basic membrane protein A
MHTLPDQLLGGLTLACFAPKREKIMPGSFRAGYVQAPGRALLFIIVSVLLACMPARAEFKVGLVLDRGGKDDKSFNSSAYQGANEAKSKLGVFLKYVEATDDNAFEPLLRAFAQRDFDVIIGVGFAQKEPIKKVAALFPQKHFVIVDAQVDAPNVCSLLFEEHEGAYVVGAIAAMTTKTAKVGFVGGMDVPLIRRFAMGYEAGAKKINPQITVLENYVGVTSEAWNNPPKGKELAMSQYEAGADIIFAAAGASGLGVFDAAEETKKFAIGVDANQDWTKPGLILTSMLKKLDEAVFATIQEAKSGKFASGVKRFGLANKGIDYSVDQYNEKILTQPVRKRADELKADIIAGKIIVPDYYKR